jgi:glutamate dehydrogenase/leucine dehydrogenase
MTIAFSVFLAVAWGQPWRLLAQGPAPATGVSYSKISETDMKDWLSYLASDELQGRQVFTEGYGRATQYVADQLKSFGVKPIGVNGTYFQPVKLKGHVTRN